MRSNLSGLPAAARRSKMRALINRRGFALVSDLARIFSISEVTVRGDLNALAQTNTIRRVHGGAMTADYSASMLRTSESSFDKYFEEKSRIGLAAANLVESHQVIALDAGTTTMAVARALALRDDLKNVTVVTNALDVTQELGTANPRITVIVTGGTYRPSLQCLVDPLAASVLGRVRSDIAFIGSNGVSVGAGVTNVSLAEAEIKRRILDNASKAVLVADSSKLGVARASRICGIDELTALVTGHEAPESGVAALRNAGLQVLRA